MNKLIEPTNLYYAGSINPSTEVCLTKEVRELEQLNNEMLWALVKTLKHYETTFGANDEFREMWKDCIEKATKKSWEEIRSSHE